MPIEMNDSLRIKAGKPSESKYFNDQNAPYATTAEVLSAIPVAERHDGLTVKILDVEYWFLADLVTLVVKGDNYEYWKLKAFGKCVKLGYLYNFPAVIDGRNIASDETHVPTKTELETLWTAIGGTAEDTNKLKVPGFVDWLAPNTGATNEYGFNARGDGQRNEFGNYQNIGASTWIQSSTPVPGTALNYQLQIGYTTPGTIIGVGNKIHGRAVRLIKNITTLTEGQTGELKGNDGRVYPTVCIGGMEIMSCNLAETLFRDLSPITKVTDSTAWGLLETEGYCTYNNNEANVFEAGSVVSQVHSHDLVEFVAGENIQIGLADKTITISGTRATKNYSGLVSQAGTAAPTIAILQDDITGIVLARTAAGTYTFTKIGAFPAGKTIPNKQEDYTDSDGNLLQMIYTSADVMTLKTYAAVNTAVLADGVLVDQFINIEIYN